MVIDTVLEKVFCQFRYRDDLFLEAVRQTQRYTQLLRGVRLRKPVRQNRHLLREIARAWCRAPALVRQALDGMQMHPVVVRDIADGVALAAGVEPSSVKAATAGGVPKDPRDPMDPNDLKLVARLIKAAVDVVRKAEREDFRAGLLHAAVLASGRPGLTDGAAMERTATLILLAAPQILDETHEELSDFGELFVDVLLSGACRKAAEAFGIDAVDRRKPAEAEHGASPSPSSPAAVPAEERTASVPAAVPAGDSGLRDTLAEALRSGWRRTEPFVRAKAADAVLGVQTLSDLPDRSCLPEIPGSRGITVDMRSVMGARSGRTATAPVVPAPSSGAAPATQAEAERRTPVEAAPGRSVPEKSEAAEGVEPEEGASAEYAAAGPERPSALTMIEARPSGGTPAQTMSLGGITRIVVPDPRPGSFITAEPASDVTRWLGYVRRSTSSCRNFFPVARWEPGVRAMKGFFKPVSRREAAALFPRLGGLNLSGCRASITDGALVVIDLMRADTEFNARADGGVRDDFEYRLDWQKLSVEGRIRPASDFGVWYVVHPVEKNVCTGRPVAVRLLPGAGSGAEKCPGIAGVPVLVAVGGRWAGPVPLHEDASRRCCVNLEGALEDGMAAGFAGQGVLRRLTLAERSGRDEWTDREVSWIEAGRLNPVRMDLVSDEALLRRLAAVAPDTPDAASLHGLEGWLASGSAAETLFSAVPAVRDARVRRLIELLEHQRFTEGLYGDVGRILSAALPEAALCGGRLFEAVVERFASDPALRERLESERGLAERIRSDEARAKALRTELEMLERRLSERRTQGLREIETERTRLLTERKRLDAEVKAHSKGLESLIESAGLAGVKARLEEEVRTLEERNARLKAEAEGLDARLRDAVADAGRYAFDGALSAKLLDAAAAWRTGEEKSAVKETVRQAAAAPVSTLSGTRLADRLLESVRAVRAYPENDVLNLFVTVTQNFLTVLAGPPGSGKTSICFILAHLLGLTNPADGRAGRFLSVSVERGWTSKRDFIGYWNPLTKTFESTDPARREAFLRLDAEARAGIAREPFLMLLDEANLSPMEYYWADFMNAADERSALTEITLGDGMRCRLPETLRFLATINSDHTTEALSPRLIDRAVFVTLPEPSDEALFGQNARVRPVDAEPVGWEALARLFGARPAGEGRAASAGRPGLDAVLSVLSTGGLRVSMRRRIAMERFMSAASVFRDDPVLDQTAGAAAADLAVSQFLLPGISGMGAGCRKTLEELLTVCGDRGLTRSAGHLERMIRQGGAAMDCYAFLS